MRKLFAILLIAIGGGFLWWAALMVVSAAPEPPQQIVLVGQGCDGPNAIVVALEEDMMPTCDRIDAHNVVSTYE